MRLIDSDKLEEKIEEINSIDYGSMDSFEAHNAVSDCLRDIVRMIDYQPVVDAVPVVRCKGCINSIKISNPSIGGYVCKRNIHVNNAKEAKIMGGRYGYNHFNADDFCSYGERKDADTP